MTAGRFASVVLLAAVGCGGAPATVFVGESAHFRLYVDPALMPLPAAFAGENALAALETEWADVATMLKMPDAQISYYWYSTAHVSAACDDDQEGGCTKEEEMEIDAAMLPDAHELNHAYTYLRAPRRPIPFLAEGIAEAIGCGYESPIAAPPEGDWRSAVAGVRSDAVYGLGGLFVRQMIRRHGIDEFLRYYEQAPERRDPALFAANFQSFWGEAVDDVWTEITTVVPAVPYIDQKICPCSLPAITPGDDPVDDPARVPYWTLPDVGDQTIALTASPAAQVNVRSCAGNEHVLQGKGALVRRSSSARWYALAPLGAAAIDAFLADSCAGAAHYALPEDVLVGNPYLSISIPATASSVLFLAIDVPFPIDGMQVRGVDAFCASCAFDDGSCTPIASAVATPVTGGFYGRMRFQSSDIQLRDGANNDRSLRFFR
jgi:hypothetical protein